jgi:hypothetical protein
LLSKIGKLFLVELFWILYVIDLRLEN